jgi:hypothetical protein
MVIVAQGRDERNFSGFCDPAHCMLEGAFLEFRE